MKKISDLDSNAISKINFFLSENGKAVFSPEQIGFLKNFPESDVLGLVNNVKFVRGVINEINKKTEPNDPNHAVYSLLLESSQEPVSSLLMNDLFKPIKLIDGQVECASLWESILAESLDESEHGINIPMRFTDVLAWGFTKKLLGYSGNVQLRNFVVSKNINETIDCQLWRVLLNSLNLSFFVRYVAQVDPIYKQEFTEQNIEKLFTDLEYSVSDEVIGNLIRKYKNLISYTELDNGNLLIRSQRIKNIEVNKPERDANVIFDFNKRFGYTLLFIVNFLQYRFKNQGLRNPNRVKEFNCVNLSDLSLEIDHLKYITDDKNVSIPFMSASAHRDFKQYQLELSKEMKEYFVQRFDLAI